MMFTCEIHLQSFVDNGYIQKIGKGQEVLQKKNYSFIFELDSLEKKKLFSIKNLDIGIEKGIIIKELIINNFNVKDIKASTFFDMIGNPYVTNKKITEENLVFNGDLYIDLSKECLEWSPHFFSKKEIDFVFCNNIASCQNVYGCYSGENQRHDLKFYNVPYDPKIKLGENEKIGLGCSVTFGTGVKRNKTWPSLLGFENLGVPAIGIDGIYFNLKSIFEIFKPSKIIILFPNLQRRLIKFKKNDLYFRIPFTIGSNLPKLYEKNYFWISKDEIEKFCDRVKHEIIEDLHNNYSKQYLSKIAEFDCDILVSSWSKETYKILPDYFDKILPFFDWIDDAVDGPKPHPGPKSHGNWAEKIKRYYI